MYPAVKRVIDTLLAFFALVLLAPLWLCLGIAIRLDSPGPVFFIQKRIGLHKTFFSIFKFRTMRMDTPQDTPTHLLADPGSRITRSGRWLRRTSLDEVPQLLNILRGDMSLIGPRPALWNQDDLIAERDKYGANDVRPGLTGWAQVNGRDELPIAVKARLDGEYVSKMSLMFDAKCFLMTLASVLRADGVVEGASRSDDDTTSQ